MKRSILAALALVMVIGLQPQAARAQDANANWNSFWNWVSHGQDPRLTVGGIGVGIGADVTGYYLSKKHGTPPHRPMTVGAAYGVTAYACAVVYPFVGTWLLNRPLTPREMYVGVADCIVPFVGGWVVDTYLPHDAWTDGLPPKKVAHK